MLGLATGFTKSDAEEERERIAPLVRTAVKDTRDWDVDAYVLDRSWPGKTKTATERFEVDSDELEIPVDGS